MPSTSDIIRKFERLLLSARNSTDKPIKVKKRNLIGTYTYDFENGTEKYTPARKKSK